MSTLTAEEEKLVYNIEVLGMSQVRAAEMSGAPTSALQRNDLKMAREKLRGHVREQTKITREDIVAGLQEAVDMSRIVSDPMAMIAAWRETAKILGFDKPAEINIHISGDVKEIRRQVRALPEHELLRLADENNVIDGDFYDLSGQGTA